ncbi:MAG: hypothetical protein QW291_07950 [Thermofilaceae archaeon]
MSFSRIYAEVSRKLLEKGFLNRDELDELYEIYGDNARDALDALVAAGAARYTAIGVEAVNRQKLARIAKSTNR